jgi:hypothetical protein
LSSVLQRCPFGNGRIDILYRVKRSFGLLLAQTAQVPRFGMTKEFSMKHVSTTPVHRRVLRVLVLCMAAGLAAAAHAGKANDTLVYASDNEVENVSPYHNNMREGVILANMAWDTLVYRDQKTGEYKPQLATAWKWESPTALLLTPDHRAVVSLDRVCPTYTLDGGEPRRLTPAVRAWAQAEAA